MKPSDEFLNSQGAASTKQPRLHPLQQNELSLNKSQSYVDISRTLKPQFKASTQPLEQSPTVLSLINVKKDQSKTQLPRSLISPSMKLEESDIMDRNYNMAKKVLHLQPLTDSELIQSQLLRSSSSSDQSDSDKPAKPKKKRSLQINALPKNLSRYQTYLEALNEQTQGRFSKTKSYSTLNLIDQKVHYNSVLCCMHLKEFKFFDQYDFNNPKNPLQFFWEVKYRGRIICKTQPKNYNRVCQELLDFVYTKSAYDKVEVHFYKLKNNTDTYIGQIELEMRDFYDSNMVLDYHSRIITEKIVEKEMYKVLSSSSAYLGNVMFKLVQFGSDNLPLNKHSNIPGSPRDQATRDYHRRIEESKRGEWDWTVSESESITIELINDATQHIVVTISLEQAISNQQDRESGKYEIIFSTEMTYDPKDPKKAIRFVKKIGRKEAQAVMDILKSLDENAALTEVHSKMKNYGYKARITRKNIEDGLKECGCTAAQLFLLKKDDMGLSLLDILLLDDQLPAVLEVLNQTDLLGVHDSSIDEFAKNLFTNIAKHLRRNQNLKSTQEFIKSLKNYPSIGVVISNYAMLPHVYNKDTNPFLSSFDMDNFEHVQILGKTLKLMESNLNECQKNDLFKQLEIAYIAEKRRIYYKVPCLPKKGDLAAKKDMLSLTDLGGNIFHEGVRRQRWNMVHKGFKQEPNWFFEKDVSGCSPLMNLIEKAPLETVFTFIMEYLDEIIKNEQFVEQVTANGRNIFHNLVLNKDMSSGALLENLRTLTTSISNQGDLLQQVWEAGELTPLALYLDVLRKRCKHKKDKVIKEIATILQIVQLLAAPLRKTFNNLAIRHKAAQIAHQAKTSGVNRTKPTTFDKKDRFSKDAKNAYLKSGIIGSLDDEFLKECDEYYFNSVQIGRILSKFDEAVMESLCQQLNWIDWMGYTAHFPYDLHVCETLMTHLVKHGKFAKVASILERLAPDQAFVKVEGAVAIPDETGEDSLYLCNAQVIVACLKQVEVSNNKRKDELKQILQGKLKQFIAANPSIVAQPIIGSRLFGSKGANETLLNQLFWIGQHQVLYALKRSDFAKFPQERLANLIINAFKSQNLAFFGSEIIQEILANFKVDSTSKALQDLDAALRTTTANEKYFGLGSIFVGILKQQQSKPASASVAQPTEEKGENEVVTLDYRYFAETLRYIIANDVRLSSGQLGFLVLNGLDKQVLCKLRGIIAGFCTAQGIDRLVGFITRNIEALKSDDILEPLLQKLRTPENNTFMGKPLYYFTTLIKQNATLFKAIRVARLFQHYLNIQYMPGIHQLLVVMQSGSIERRKQFQKAAGLLRYNETRFSVNYLRSIGGHYLSQLSTKQFVALLNDVNDTLEPKDIAELVYLAGCNGMPEKLRVLLQINKLPSIIPVTAKIASVFFFAQLDGQSNYRRVTPDSEELQTLGDLSEIIQYHHQQCSIQQFSLKVPNTIKPNKTNPKLTQSESFSAAPSTAQLKTSKWSSMLGVNQLQDSQQRALINAAQNTNNLINSQLVKNGTLEQELYKNEYYLARKNTFLHQRINVQFNQTFPSDPLDKQDFRKTLDTLLESLIKSKSLVPMLTYGQEHIEFKNSLIVALPNQHDKIIDLIRTQSPYPAMMISRCVCSIVKWYQRDKGEKKYTHILEASDLYFQEHQEVFREFVGKQMTFKNLSQEKILIKSTISAALTQLKSGKYCLQIKSRPRNKVFDEEVLALLNLTPAQFVEIQDTEDDAPVVYSDFFETYLKTQHPDKRFLPTIKKHYKQEIWGRTAIKEDYAKFLVQGGISLFNPMTAQAVLKSDLPFLLPALPKPLEKDPNKLLELFTLCCASTKPQGLQWFFDSFLKTSKEFVDFVLQNDVVNHFVRYCPEKVCLGLLKNRLRKHKFTPLNIGVMFNIGQEANGIVEWICRKQMTQFHKEFFYDFLQQDVFGNNRAAFTKFLTDLYTQKTAITENLQNAQNDGKETQQQEESKEELKLQSEPEARAISLADPTGSDKPKQESSSNKEEEGKININFALDTHFYEMLHTAVHEKIKIDLRYQKTVELSILQRASLSFMSPVELDKEAHFNPLTKSCLKLFRFIRENYPFNSIQDVLRVQYFIFVQLPTRSWFDQTLQSYNLPQVVLIQILIDFVEREGDLLQFTNWRVRNATFRDSCVFETFQLLCMYQ